MHFLQNPELCIVFPLIQNQETILLNIPEIFG